MSLAHAYAATIREVDKSSDTKAFGNKLIAFMRARGHMSLLPEIVRILERGAVEVDTPIVTVATKESLKEFAKDIKSALASLDHSGESVREVIDPRIVGGYSVRAGSKILDTSFRSALVGLYQNVVSRK